MKYKTKKRIQGSISVLLVIILLPTMILSAVIVDTSRINMARSMVSSAGDLAVNSALADYDTILKDVYGLFAMSQAKTEDELYADIEEYFKDTLVNYGIVNEAESGDYVKQLMGNIDEWVEGVEPKEASNFMKMEVGSDFTVTKEDHSSLSNPAIMRKQIVDYMKYRAPLNFGLSFLDSVKAFSLVQEQTVVVEAQVAAQEELQGVAKGCRVSIDTIREFDKLISDINIGVRRVESLNTIKTPDEVVLLRHYVEQLDKYKKTWGENQAENAPEEWGENYKRINQLAMIYLLNSPSLADKYLSKFNYNANEFFITDEGTLRKNNSGASATMTPGDDFDSVTAALESIRRSLTGENETGGIVQTTYTKVRDGYVKDTYLSDGLINDTKTDFGNDGKQYDEAMKQFIAFEGFLLNDTNYATITYDEVKQTLDMLYTYEVFAEKQIDLYNSKIQEKEKERDDKKKEMDEKGDEVNAAEQYIQEGINARNYATQKYNEWQNAISAKTNAETAYNSAQNAEAQALAEYEAAEAALSGFSGKMSDYLALVADKDAKAIAYAARQVGTQVALQAYNSASAAETNAYNTYVSANNAAPSDWQMQQRYSAKAILEDEYEVLETEYNALVDEVNLLKSEKALAESKYKAVISQYLKFVQFYQHDLLIYEQLKLVAKAQINNKVTPIKTQFNQIKDNLLTIKTKLEEIELSLGQLYIEIEEYNAKIGEWEGLNNTYADTNGSDTFSDQNTADIKSSRTEYNLTSLKTLRDYVTNMREQYDEFYNYIMDADSYKYGNVRIDTMENCDMVLNAVPADVKNSLPSIVEEAKADAILENIYKGGKEPKVELGIDDNRFTFVSGEVVPIQFLKFLNTNYPVDAKPLQNTQSVGGGTAATTEEEGKAQYEELKDDVKNDEEGQKAIDDKEVKSNPYGYTYMAPKNGMPNKKDIPSGYGEDKTKNKSNKSFSMNTKDSSEEDKENTEVQEIDAAKSMEDQKGKLNNTLSGVGDVLGASLENIYIVSYIFGNFSYNTIAQDTIAEATGKTYDTYPEALQMKDDLASKDGKSVTISDGKGTKTVNVKELLGTAKTLSNYNITAANNYLYGGEIEYILYGNDSISKNITTAKASIYAIRFAFNSIFAFTDSEIKNTTMAAGMAIQAATLGFVPYKLVQVVLQLALAAAESAVDLDMMNRGLKVVVVKTRDSWNMSVSGAVNMITDVIEDQSAEMIANLAQKAVEAINEGINTVMEATAENLQSTISNLTETVQKATKNKAQEMVDSIYTQLQGAIDEALNTIQYTEYVTIHEDGSETEMTKQQIEEKVNEAFDKLAGNVDVILSKYTNHQLGQSLLEPIKVSIIGVDGQGGILNEVKGKVVAIIQQEGLSSVGDRLCEEMMQIKFDAIGILQNAIMQITEEVEILANESIADIASQLSKQAQACVGEAGKEFTEEAAEKVKKDVVKSLNDFTNTYLKDAEEANVSIGTGGTSASKSTGSKIASMIKFGYKDYLMLFTFIAVCASDDNVLLRVGDVIQMNLMNADKTSKSAAEGSLTNALLFQHGKGKDFSLSEAKTYVSVEATVNLDMLLLDMEFFNRLFGDPATVESQLDAASGIHYKGLAGY